MEIEVRRVDGGMSVASLNLVCQDCGHVVEPGESMAVCRECGGTNLKFEKDATRTVTLQCAA